MRCSVDAVSVLQWLSQSPDQNPSENLWHCLKIAVKKKQHLYILSNLEQTCWDDGHAKLVGTNPNRLKAVKSEIKSNIYNIYILINIMNFVLDRSLQKK